MVRTQPWQRATERVDCRETVQVVQRTAGNLYYSVVHSALDIPEAEGSPAWEGEAAERVRASTLWLALCSAPDGPNAPALRQMIKQETQADDALIGTFLAEEAGTPVTTATALDKPVYPDLSSEEWAALTAPASEATRDFVVRHTDLGLSRENQALWATLRERIGNVVLVDRLREVRALQGFTRVAPDATFVPADTSRRLRWLPAVEVYGEGVFLTLDAGRLADWERCGAVRNRVLGICADLDRSFQKDRLEAHTGTVMAPRFVLLHTLAHLLIRQLSFESGYTTASLRERVYARADRDQAGLLVYTAAGDAAGTLGGLVQQGEPPHLAEILLRMIEAAAWCSADPLCAEHSGQGFGNLNRGACHACALLPETSCEMGNTLLDRVLVVGGGGVPASSRT
ncbi:DrmB family protein [Streptomyces sp. NPDC058735]|uniref:DrmB family protein n=1 Tax=unclassified Streptomyces TaxID=2593676 RepID=UPI0036B2E7A0